MQRTVADLPLKQPVDLTVLRDGKNIVLHVTITEQPGDFGLARPGTEQEKPSTSDGIVMDKIGIELATWIRGWPRSLATPRVRRAP